MLVTLRASNHENCTGLQTSMVTDSTGQVICAEALSCGDSTRFLFLLLICHDTNHVFLRMLVHFLPDSHDIVQEGTKCQCKRREKKETARCEDIMMCPFLLTEVCVNIFQRLMVHFSADVYNNKQGRAISQCRNSTLRGNHRVPSAPMGVRRHQGACAEGDFRGESDCVAGCVLEIFVWLLTRPALKRKCECSAHFLVCAMVVTLVLRGFSRRR